ncbi:MAG: EamA family transporter RarD [Rhodobacteraceae bacterium]|nr:EamA family transporter RarD [Paracoccaceae bacterium]
MSDTQKGIFAIVAASATWGFSPVYFKLLEGIPASEVLAHRTLWSLVFFGGILFFQGRLGEIYKTLSQWRFATALALASFLISVNWFLFIHAVQIGKTTETSLGYYINPLMAVVLGRFWFGERLNRGQWFAVGLAAIAVTLLTLGLGVAPWISLVLALSFAIYGAIKKQLAIGPIVSVTCEVLIFLPVGLTILYFAHKDGHGYFGSSVWQTALLIGSGPLTALPLILFAFGVRRLALSTVGLLLYINPTLQLFCAVVIFGDPFSRWHIITFAMIWVALTIYTIAARKTSMASAGVSTTDKNSASSGSANP